MILKNLVLQALGTIWFRFLQKKYLKKIHACVPLSKCIVPEKTTFRFAFYSYHGLRICVSDKGPVARIHSQLCILQLCATNCKLSKIFVL
jgi:hypothetical protein